MVNFTKKVIGLASAAVVFAGMAFGQSTCTSSATTNIIRAEGTTEQVAPITITCNGAGASGTASLQVFLSPSLPITSKVTARSTVASPFPTALPVRRTNVDFTRESPLDAGLNGPMTPTLRKRSQCPGWESNPHDLYRSKDFKSSASAVPPPGRGHADYANLPRLSPFMTGPRYRNSYF